MYLDLGRRNVSLPGHMQASHNTLVVIIAMSIRTEMDRLLSWFRAFRSHLMKAWHLWLALFPILIVFFLLWKYGVTEPRIRTAGLVLQLAGLCTVVWGIQETRMLFGRPAWFTVIRQWFGCFPAYRRQAISGKGNYTMPAFKVHARGHASASASRDPTIETRIEALENNVSHINDRITQTQKEMDDRFREQIELFEAEQETRRKQVEELRTKLEMSETGGLRISLVGALWLFVGAILSTAAPELAGWLK